MALTPAQILNSLLCLGLPTRAAAAFNLYGDTPLQREGELAKILLNNLSPEQETTVIEILALWDLAKYDTDVITATNLKSAAANDRALYRKRMADTIGYSFPISGRARMGRG
jgi:hypothetical protein